MLQEQLIEEIKQIPDEKLAEIYDLIHYFSLGLAQEKPTKTISQRPIGLAKGQLEIPASFFEPLPDDILDAFEGMRICQAIAHDLTVLTSDKLIMQYPVATVW